MCQKSPGPRCAHHLQDMINKTRNQLVENKTAWTTGEPIPYPDASARLSQLKDEYDETRTGQNILAGKINAAENNDMPQMDIDVIRSRMIMAANRREAKLAALKSVESGNPKAAKKQLIYGATAGWLADTTFANSEEPETYFSVYKDYAVTSHSTFSEEQKGFEEQAQTYQAVTCEVDFQAPITSGPKPGTWVIGAEKTRRNHESKNLYMTYPEANGSNQTFKPVQPVLYNEDENTVVLYNNRTQQPIGDSVPMDSYKALEILDRHDGAQTLQYVEGNSQINEYVAGETKIELTKDGYILKYNPQLFASNF